MSTAAPVRAGTWGHPLGRGREVGAGAAVVLGCPSVAGAPSLEHQLWLHLLASVLHGSR